MHSFHHPIEYQKLKMLVMVCRMNYIKYHFLAKLEVSKSMIILSLILQSLLQKMFVALQKTTVWLLSESIHHVSNHLWMTNGVASSNLSTYVHRVDIWYSYHYSPHAFKKSFFLCASLTTKRRIAIFNWSFKTSKYLNLSWNEFKVLPESWCKLWNLQIFKLDQCFISRSSLTTAIFE